MFEFEQGFQQSSNLKIAKTSFQALQVTNDILAYIMTLRRIMKRLM